VVERTLTTDATSTRTAPPDLGAVEVTATGTGGTPPAAREAAADRAATVRGSLSGVVDEEHVGTTEFDLTEGSSLFDEECEAPFRATERLAVECPPARARDAVVAATDAGGTVEAVRLDLREETRRAVHVEALADAMALARRKAEAAARAEGLSVDGVGR
jgi:uncharacterized protein YggE